MKKFFYWVVWLVVAAAGYGWAFGVGAGTAHKLFYVVGLLVLGLFLVGNYTDGSEDNKSAKNKNARPAKSTAKTANSQVDAYAGNYGSISMDTNIIKTHQHAHPAVSNDFFKYTARYWKEKPIGHSGINGTPGVGLNSSGFSNGRVKAGQAGEKELAQMMCYLGIASYEVKTYWSLRLPNSDLDTDVDAIVSYNNNIILLDAKQYIAGENLKYERVCDGVVNVRDTNTNRIVKTYTFSRNMEMALEKYSQMFPTAHVEGAVLLCPTRNGIAATDANLGICNGKLAVTQSWAYLQDLKADIDKTHGMTRPSFDSKLKSLLKS